VGCRGFGVRGAGFGATRAAPQKPPSDAGRQRKTPGPRPTSLRSSCSGAEAHARNVVTSWGGWGQGVVRGAGEFAVCFVEGANASAAPSMH
jgi:hypothetical protein